VARIEEVRISSRLCIGQHHFDFEFIPIQGPSIQRNSTPDLESGRTETDHQEIMRTLIAVVGPNTNPAVLPQAEELGKRIATAGT
jgi:hypothetical protein